MFQYPYGDSQQLNLDWLMEQWQETKASIDGSLQGEIDRVEAAITDLLTARDQAVAAQTAAETAATSASGYAGTASAAASTATAQATAAAASAALAGTHASNAQTSETNAGLQATAAGNSASASAVSATNARNSELAAAASSSAAAGNALYAEGMAKGTQNGTPVTSGSPYYEDNSAYWAGEAQVHASNAVAAAYYSEAMAKGTVNGAPVASGEPGYEDNAEYYKDQAAAQAAAAAASAASADGAAAQAMIAQVESSSTAAAAHAAGTYFRLNGVLYMATQDIAVGATITPGTNCSVAVLGNDVSELKTAVKNATEDYYNFADVELVHRQLSNAGEIGTVVRNYLASTPNFFTLPYSTVIVMPEKYHIKYFKFDSEGTLEYTSSMTTTIDNRIFIEKNKKYRFQISNSDVGTSGTLDIDTVKKDAKYYSESKMLSDVTYIWEKLYPSFVSVNHRGYNSVAPENTLPAYRLSKSKGFAFGETDVQWTSDGVPVLLHDASINRTARNADGTTISSTVNIASITYEEALEYDFGIYKGEEYEGTKIPTFTEFITLCKNIGLYAVIQIGINNASDAQLSNLVSIVKSLGMEKCVIWLCDNYAQTRTITKLCKCACVGMYGYSITAAMADYLAGSLTGENKLFYDFTYGQGSGSYNWNSETAMDICEARNILFGVYDANLESSIKALSSRVRIVTSDTAVPDKVMYDANIGDSDTGLITE